MIAPLKPVALAGDPALPPVIFLHGFLGNANSWQPVADALARRHYVLGVNLPGHGRGWDDLPVDTLDMAACAEGIVTHLDAMGLAHPALVGYSMGGRVALYLASRYPDRFSRLVLESASPGLDSERKREIRRVQDYALAERLAELEPQGEGFRAFLEVWYAMPLFASVQRDPDMLATLIERRHQDNTPALLAQSLRALGTGSQASLWPELHAFKTPTLVLAGEKDRKFRFIAEDMALACPAMATEILTGCGHNTHLENVDAFVTAVRAFLNPAGNTLRA